MGVIGLIVGYFFGLIAYILLLAVLGPMATDARNFGEAGDTWVGTVATLQSFVWAILGAWWAARGFPLRRRE